MASDSSVYLSVIIPAYNEELRLPETLGQVLRYLSTQPYRSEVIVVDDGSTDGTARILRGMSGGGVPIRVCAHADGTNHGKGAAVKLGMVQAVGAYRLFMDADNSTSIDQIGCFWPAFKEGFDVVVGSRKAPGAQVVVHQPWYKELAGRAGNFLIRKLAVPGISDTQAGFKMFTGHCAADLFPRATIRRWGYDFEILAIARAHGYRIREIPIRWVNSPDSKVRMGSYLQVLSEVWQVHRNLKAGRYR
jgi:dolichyl-phosphate beta-glucosyltransferase